MKKVAWLVVVLVGLYVAIPFDKVFAQEEKAAPAAAAPAAPAAPAKDVKAPAPAPGLTMTPDATKEEAPKSHGGILEIIFRSGWFGVLIWLMLIVCSLVSVALTVDSFLTIREKAISPQELVTQVRSAMEQGDLLKAIQQCDKMPGPLSRILKAGFANVQEGFEVIQDSVGVAADLESEKLLQRVTYLSVISNTTPMLGLIGTVQGMIFAFATLGTTQAGAAQQAMLALNISHGLWATAVGLGTAVPATIFFYFFKNKATRIILQMEAMTLDLIKSLRNVEVVEE